MSQDFEAARGLPPEDIRSGQYVTVLYTVSELFPWWCVDEAIGRQPDVVRFRKLPGEDETAPMRVIDVCLPFVLVKRLDGQHRTLDVRQVTLARVADRFGRRAFRRAKTEKEKTV
jgi:hypothetical protein